MAKRKTSEKSGLPPGALVHIGEKKAETAIVTLMEYGPDLVTEKRLHSIEECLLLKESPGIVWINIDGLHDTGLIEKIGECFNIHPLILEDILHTRTRPKLEVFDTGIFLVFNMLYNDEAIGEILSEQFSIILGSNFVISFQERENPLFNPLMERIRSNKSRIRKKGADYLAYALLDMAVDSYFIILETLEEKIEALDEELITSLSRETFTSISSMKRNLITMRKAVVPLRELINTLEKNETDLIDDETLIFFRDIYDHVLQIQETTDIYREIVSGLHDIYLANVNNKTSEIMKTLTITATIFIPLTFIAGIYGMNFKYMPELEWEYGYFAVWVLIACVVGTMFYFFKKKNWF
jgi:magnesium transporter